MTLAVLEPAAPAAEAVFQRRSLAGRTRAGLSEALAEIGIPEKQRRMRVGQLWNWIYHYGVRDFAEMSTIGKGLRADLAERFTLDLPEVTAEQVSTDGTRMRPMLRVGAYCRRRKNQIRGDNTALS